MSALNFNATEVEPQSDFTPLPAGDYLVQITNSEIKPTKSGTGEYLQLTLQVIDGPYKNRLVFDRINVRNQNPTAQQIGQRQLSALCHSIGVLNVQDSTQLHNILFIVSLAIRKDEQYGDSNDVKAYKSSSGQTPAVNTSPATTSQPAIPQAQPHPAAQVATKPAWVQ